jgi:hypothetical protein
MSPTRFTPLHALTLLGAAGAVACNDAATTAPSDAASSPYSALTLTADDSTAFVAALSDIQCRIVPTFGNAAAASALQSALTRLGAGLASRDRAIVEAAIGGGEGAIANLVAAANGGAESDAHGRAAIADQDLDAVRLVLRQARATLAAMAE